MENSFPHLAQDIRLRRRELKLSQVELALLAGVSERWIREFEHGKDSVRLDKLTQVLHVLGMQLRADVRGLEGS